MKKVILPLSVLVLFSGYTLYAMLVSQESLLDFGVRLMSSVDTAQVVIDLYIFCGLACIWMYYDNKASGGRFVVIIPYVLVTAVFASIGPLLYLVVKGFKNNYKGSKV